MLKVIQIGCIDKTSSAELSEAINSMFNWYSRADRCYAYLSDVTAHSIPDIADSELVFDRETLPSLSQIDLGFDRGEEGRDGYKNLHLQHLEELIRNVEINDQVMIDFWRSRWFTRGWICKNSSLRVVYGSLDAAGT